MKKIVKVSIIAGSSLIVLGTLAYFVRKKIRKAKLDKPCRGKDCEEDLAGVQVYTLGSYANVRSTAEVDNKSGCVYGYCWDDETNLIGKVDSGLIGTIITAVTGEDKLNWYKVNLAKPLNGKTIGFVREDVITIKK
tara:strand:- start:996 stop:1403 length:408 start_codon:yes stop_codon:yes gene_type:complete